jgi:hypothetical protein
VPKCVETIVFIPPKYKNSIEVKKDVNWFVYTNLINGNTVFLSVNPKDRTQYYHHISSKRALETRLVHANQVVTYLLRELGFEEGSSSVS